MIDPHKPSQREPEGVNEDEQLQLDMRALAELLLDIYEYRMRLDGDHPRLNMKERSH